MPDYLTYDEIQIGALLGIASPTPFINNGTPTFLFSHPRPLSFRIQTTGGFFSDASICFDFEPQRLQKVVIVTQNNLLQISNVQDVF